MSRFDRLFYSAAALCMVAGLALMSCAYSDAPWLPSAALAPSEAFADEGPAEVPPPEATQAAAAEPAGPPVTVESLGEDRPVAPPVLAADPMVLKVSLPEPVERLPPPAAKAGEPAAAPRPTAEAPTPVVRKAAWRAFRPHAAGQSGARARPVALLPSSGHGSAAKNAGVRDFSARSGSDPLKTLFGFAHRLLEPTKARVAAATDAAPEAR